MFRGRLELVEGQVHRAVRCLVNVDAVNHLHIHARNRPADFRVRGQDRVILLTLRLRELLGIIEPTESALQALLRPGAGEDDSSGDYRPGERAAARFVHARDKGQAFLPKLAFVGEPVPKFGAQCISTSQVPRPLR